MIEAEIAGKRIAVYASYADFGPTRAKAIAGRKWDRELGANTYPLSWATCVALRKELGDRLTVGPDLTKWAWDEHRRAEQMEALRAGADADLPAARAAAPKLWSALQTRPFQIAGAAFVAGGKAVCLGDEPRLGKTYQALAAIVESGAEAILIACPKTATRSVWRAKILELVGNGEAVFVAQEDRANRELVLKEFAAATGRRWLVINKEMVRVKKLYACPDGTEWRIAPARKNGCRRMHDHKIKHVPFYPEVHATVYDAIILDECHHLLASTKNVGSKDISQIRNGAVKLKIRPGGIKLAMSGTPFRSDLLKSWGVLNWLHPEIFRSFWAYADEHWGVKSGAYGNEIAPKLKDPAAFDAMLRRYYLARTIADVAPQLPPIQYADTYLDMSEKQAKAYAQIQENGLAELDSGRLLANGVLAELTRMKQFACSYGKMSAGEFIPALPSNKLDWVFQFLTEREATGIKVVIASQFTKLVKLFAEELRNKYRVLTLTGESTSRQRDHAQDMFQNGDAQIIIINMFAGGEAIDLSAADELIFLDEPWTDDTRQQAELRIRNLGKTSQLTVYRLRSEGTVEDWIASMTDEQRKLLLAAKPKAIEQLKEKLS